MRKEITIVQITCDWCKKNCDKATTIFGNYDVCEPCEEEMKSILDFNPENDVTVTDEHREKLFERLAAETDVIAIPTDISVVEKKPRGRKKKEETHELDTFKYVISTVGGLDMRKREHADLVEKAIEKLPENPTDLQIKEAIAAVPVYFSDCDDHKEKLKECLTSMGFDFANEEDRAEAMTIRLGLIQERIDIKTLGEWILGNVERKDTDLPF